MCLRFGTDNFVMAFKKDGIKTCWFCALALGTFVPPWYLFESHNKIIRDEPLQLPFSEIALYESICYIVVMETPLIIAFGSRVKGTATPSSDFDFGALKDGLFSLSERADLSLHIAEKMNINEDSIDLVDLSTVSPILKWEVAKTGKLIEGESFDFIRFKIRAMKEYQDTAKFRRIRRDVIMQSNAK